VPGRIDPASDTPLYRQIADDLRQRILDGRLGPGAAMPSESSLMEDYGSARGTVRQAISLLKSEGFLEVARGRGAFVRRRPSVRRLAHDRFSRSHRDRGDSAFLAELRAQRQRPEVEIIEVGTEKASSEIARRLGQRSGSKVAIRRRRYFADGHPIELATSYLPWKLVDGTPIMNPNPGPGGIYARLEEIGRELGRFTEEVTTRMPLPDESRALLLSGGVPVFHLIRTAYDTQGNPVEICDTVMAGDSFILSYELPAE
jgi:GntR family transcriptional regulator